MDAGDEKVVRQECRHDRLERLPSNLSSGGGRVGAVKAKLVIVGLAALLWLGCDSDTNKKGASSAAPSSAPSGSSTVKTADVPSAAVKDAEDACADYVKELNACIDKLEGDAKAPFKKQLDEHNKSFAEASASEKAQMQEGCVTGLATLKQGCE